MMSRRHAVKRGMLALIMISSLLVGGSLISPTAHADLRTITAGWSGDNLVVNGTDFTPGASGNIDVYAWHNGAWDEVGSFDFTASPPLMFCAPLCITFDPGGTFSVTIPMPCDQSLWVQAFDMGLLMSNHVILPTCVH